MASVGVLPALAVLAGAVCGGLGGLASLWMRCGVAGIVVLAWTTWCVDRVPRTGLGLNRVTALILAVGYFLAAAILAADANDRALHTPLRAVLDRGVGGFAIEASGPAARHDPLPVQIRLLEDASPLNGVTTLHGVVTSVRLRGAWHQTSGNVFITVSGITPVERVDEWRAGRRLGASITFRRPARYLNEGVPDFERDLALSGTTLFGSVKSGLLIDLLQYGSALDEAAATVRQHVRRNVEQWVARHGVVSAAIVTAVLIGDRTGLPDEIRTRLQAAGTYHVIAISGGNIAIFAGLTLAVLLVCGAAGRPAAAVTLLVLVAYAGIVTGGASVWRATLMAVLYLGARLLDHRSPPWQALAVAATIGVCTRPLDVRDAGFILTCGATTALLAVASYAAPRTDRHRVRRWLIASLTASLAVEVALLPVSAWTFSRVTSAGLLLNLLAVPLMAVVQIGGITVSCLGHVGAIAAPAGWVAHAAASGLVESARLVELAPWLAARVPTPSLALVVAYYLGLVVALCGRGLRRACGVGVLLASAAAIVTGQPARWPIPGDDRPGLRLTVFDVGQGDATLVQFPDRSTLMVDAGGLAFGNSGFDVGSRVLSPALWARGVRGLDTILLTHGDPDHIGGAASLIDDFAPQQVWEGIPVAGHRALQEVLARARKEGAHVERRQAGEEMVMGGVHARVLHPPLPDWERQRVRNDDSVVLELLYGDLAVLLLGDVGADVERSLLSRLTPARRRVLKVAHHGSRTSSSRELLEHWRPDVAIISCGRGNTFGHPAPEVLRRFQSIGAEIYRTDLDGEVTVETDGQGINIRTYLPRR